jgi:hypothetical protein
LATAFGPRFVEKVIDAVRRDTLIFRSPSIRRRQAGTGDNRVGSSSRTRASRASVPNRFGVGRTRELVLRARFARAAIGARLDITVGFPHSGLGLVIADAISRAIRERLCLCMTVASC